MGTVIAIVRKEMVVAWTIRRGYSQKLSDSRNVLKVEVTELGDGLDVR